MKLSLHFDSGDDPPRRWRVAVLILVAVILGEVGLIVGVVALIRLG